MENGDFGGISTDKISQILSGMSPEEIHLYAKKLESPEQVAAALVGVSEKIDADWQKKTWSIITGLAQRPLLEAAGASISAMQAIEIIETASRLNHLKLLPILVGMPHSIFREILAHATNQQLRILKLESVSEPVQHHLLLFIHETTKILLNYSKDIEKLELDLNEIDILGFGRKDLEKVKKRIEQTSHEYKKILEVTNKALSIAWNTNRSDLIEKLSAIKESCQKNISYVIGHSSNQEFNSTGLFSKLEDRLALVYGNPYNPQDIEALEDDAPAIEAIAKFSIWYVQDYWEIGLLPQVLSQDKLDLDTQNHTERERAEYREFLFSQAQANLAKLGLITVRNLKDRQIFSKQTLQEYIQTNKEKLNKK